MMRILGTGKNKGFSLIEVLVTLFIITTCYIIIAKGLIKVLDVNKRIKSSAQTLLAAQKYFEDQIETDNEKYNIKSIKKSENITTRIFISKKDNIIIKGCLFETNK